MADVERYEQILKIAKATIADLDIDFWRQQPVAAYLCTLPYRIPGVFDPETCAVRNFLLLVAHRTTGVGTITPRDREDYTWRLSYFFHLPGAQPNDILQYKARADLVMLQNWQRKGESVGFDIEQQIANLRLVVAEQRLPADDCYDLAARDWWEDPTT